MPKVTEEYIANKKKMIVDTAYELCLEKTVSEQIQAKVSPGELVTYISSAYTGIQTCAIVYHCYNKNQIAQMYDARAQHRVLAKTVNYLLGVEE